MQARPRPAWPGDGPDSWALVRSDTALVELRCARFQRALIRAAVDNIEVHESSDRGYQDLAFQLTKIGTLYNQAVRLAHQTRHRAGTIPADALLDALGTHKATLARILRALVAQHPLRSAPPS